LPKVFTVDNLFIMRVCYGCITTDIDLDDHG